MSDGAAAAIVMSEERAKESGRETAGAVRCVRDCRLSAGRDGHWTGVCDSESAETRRSDARSDIDVIELNEAFAAQSLAVIKTLGLDPDKVNVNGGAIALGHPLGCTGAKLTASILRELERRNGRYGMVTMCVGGGMGAAGIFERSKLSSSSASVEANREDARA